jgi:solute carrier family 25 protein 42
MAAHAAPNVEWADERRVALVVRDAGHMWTVTSLPCAHVSQLLEATVSLPAAEAARVVEAADSNHDSRLTVEEWRHVLEKFPEFRTAASGDPLPAVPTAWLCETVAIVREQALHRRESRKLTAFESMFAGGVAGALSKTCIAPGDRVKILFQVDSQKHFTLRRALERAIQIVKEEGPCGLWRGNGAMMIRVIPYASITYMTFDRYQHFYTELLQRDTDSIVRLISGASAGATATAFTYPLDLMRARMATDCATNPRYAGGYTRAFQTVIAKEGFTTLYSGLRVTLLGIMPYAGLSFTTYETLKAQYVHTCQLKSERDIPQGYRVIFGGVAGLVGQSSTYPLDILRRRMQVSSADVYRSITGAFLHILRTEGLRKGLYKGLSMNWIKGPISVAISFSTNDAMKQLLRRVNDDTEADLSSSARYGEIKNTTPVEVAVAGGLAAAVSKTVAAPLDMVKLLSQINPKVSFGIPQLRSTASRIVQSHGVSALWTGNTAAVLRVVPFSAITFLTFDRFELLCMRRLHRDTDFVCQFLAGSAAGCTAATLTYPFDLLRARMARHWQHYTGYSAALKEIVQREGYAALFTGLKPTLMGTVLYAGFSFGTFQSTKAFLGRWRGLTHDRDLLVRDRLAAGMLAGFLGQTIAYPLHIVRRRMQVARSPLSCGGSVFRGLNLIYRSEGLSQGLFKGMSVTWAKGPITVAITFTLNDLIKSKLADLRFSDLADYEPS